MKNFVVCISILSERYWFCVMNIFSWECRFLDDIPVGIGWTVFLRKDKDCYNSFVKGFLHKSINNCFCYRKKNSWLGFVYYTFKHFRLEKIYVMVFVVLTCGWFFFFVGLSIWQKTFIRINILNTDSSINQNLFIFTYQYFFHVYISVVRHLKVNGKMANGMV